MIWWPGLQLQSGPQWSWGLEPRRATASLQLQCGEGRPAGEAGGATLTLHGWPVACGRPLVARQPRVLARDVVARDVVASDQWPASGQCYNVQ